MTSHYNARLVMSIGKRGVCVCESILKLFSIFRFTGHSNVALLPDGNTVILQFIFLKTQRLQLFQTLCFGVRHYILANYDLGQFA